MFRKKLLLPFTSISVIRKAFRALPNRLFLTLLLCPLIVLMFYGSSDSTESSQPAFEEQSTPLPTDMDIDSSNINTASTKQSTNSLTDDYGKINSDAAKTYFSLPSSKRPSQPNHGPEIKAQSYDYITKTVISTYPTKTHVNQSVLIYFKPLQPGRPIKQEYATATEVTSKTTPSATTTEQVNSTLNPIDLLNEPKLLLRQSNVSHEFLRSNYTVKPSACLLNNDERSQPFLIMLINSATRNFHLRQQVRETWANPVICSRLNILPIFLLALDSQESINRLIGSEAVIYNDILQGNFPDQYKTMSKKTLLGLHWICEYCQDQYSYTLKTDDDMYLDIVQIVEYLKFSPFRPKTIHGAYFAGWKPFRDPYSKYYLSKEEYPYSTLPPLCLGSFMIFTRDLPCPMYEEAFTAPYVWLEDVFISAMVPYRLNVSYVDLTAFGYKEGKLDQITQRRLWYAHLESAATRRSLWNLLVSFYKSRRNLIIS